MLALLTTLLVVGMIDNERSKLILDFKSVDDNGAIIQMVMWRVPHPVLPCVHDVKYRLVYVIDGRRVIGFDNERGKGDHVHVDTEEFPYKFVSIDRLVEDFLSRVENYKGARWIVN